MSTIINTHNFTIATAIGTATLFGMLSFGSSAEAAQSLASCKGATIAKVTSCCEQRVKENGRPTWMIETKTSCNKAAVCRGGSGSSPLAVVAVPKRCYIRVVELIDKNHERTRGGRGARGQAK